MWKAGFVLVIAVVGFVGAIVIGGTTTLDGRRDPCAQVDPDLCRPTTTTTSHPTTTTSPPVTSLPATTTSPSPTIAAP